MNSCIDCGHITCMDWKYCKYIFVHRIYNIFPICRVFAASLSTNLMLVFLTSSIDHFLRDRAFIPTSGPRLRFSGIFMLCLMLLIPSPTYPLPSLSSDISSACLVQVSLNTSFSKPPVWIFLMKSLPSNVASHSKT